LREELVLYENEIVRAIVLLKFERIEPLGEVVCVRLAKIVTQNADALAQMLLYPCRCIAIVKRRGYKQAELLSKTLAKLLKLPHQGVCLSETSPPRKTCVNTA